ncbi:MAG: bifunctional (p)ppGpp synthetase/guanosine-3',5'-bis(diphosphate) 3'-pyrophosphohydrolase [Gammaproteobacteria bacterium]|nr:bifunctional (p)ppGpp synthetase/guanosine-3',5'-bis(diphosphate) 3'-pyrophosphohydrolase [Gammaproteobacteria bacterium]
MDYAASFLGRLPKGKRSSSIEGLRSKLAVYMPPESVAEVSRAYEFGAQAHEGQKRMSGEPYISHPVAVASILADLHLDQDTMVAALLHDVIEDTPTAKEQLVKRFGQEVADLVDGVSKLDQLQFKSKAEAQAESFRKMMLAMVQDIRVIMVKLADRLHNMRTLGVMRPEKRRRIARETLDIYAPIANRLGINTIRLELEDLGFQALYPQRYRVLQRALKKFMGNQRQVMKKIEEKLAAALKRESILAEVESREKHLYSIYKKMRRKGIALNEILDVFGFRIVVEEPWQCYQALGIVHAQYKPMPGRFKDFIAIPRVNGYQSLHTTLFGPNGLPIEVQIRTRDMERVAESGIAAHWRYKSADHGSSAPQERAREWFQGLMEMEGKATSEEFLESVKVDLFPDKSYVFTPRGDIKRMPRGATCVDFAYAVHTDIGNRCVAAKIDRRPVPLRTPLQSGQTVEIVTARNARPNPAWVNFVVTAKARASIRAYLKNLRRSEAIDFGKKLMERALSEFKTPLRKVPRDRMQAVLVEFGLEKADDLYQQVGLGQRLAPFVARRLMPDKATDGEEERPLSITGTEGLVVSYARCCYPVPGDAIMGYLSAGRGVVIHRDQCGNLTEFRKQPDKWVAVEWNKDIAEDFNVEISVEAQNQLGVLAAVAANIASTESNIEHVSVVDRDGETSSLTFLLRVVDQRHLERVMRNIRSMPAVLQVTRRCT